MSVGASSASASALYSSLPQVGSTPSALPTVASSSYQTQSNGGPTYSSDTIYTTGSGVTPGLLRGETIGPAPITTAGTKADASNTRGVSAQNAGTLAIVVGCGVVAASTFFGIPLVWEALNKRMEFEGKNFMEGMKDRASDFADGKKIGEIDKQLNTLAKDEFADEVVTALATTGKNHNAALAKLEAPVGGAGLDATQLAQAMQRYHGRGINAAAELSVYHLRGLALRELLRLAKAGTNRDLTSHIELQHQNFFGEFADRKITDEHSVHDAHAAWKNVTLPHEFERHATFLHDVVDPLIRRTAIVPAGIR